MNALQSLAAHDLIAIAAPCGELSRVKVASSFRARFVGLLTRSRLDADEGLLLVPGGSIHTLGMRFAIDVVFVDSELQVAQVAPHVMPGAWIFAPRSTRCVLEVSEGVAVAKGIRQGVRLAMSPIANSRAISASCLKKRQRP